MPKLSFARHGDSGPALVLLHGFGGSGKVWDSLGGNLPGRVFAFDLPGHAGSLAFPGAGNARAAAQAVLAALESEGISEFHLAGHSMGGAVAALAALSAPERVLSLTLLAPGGMGPDINMPLLRRFAEAVDENSLAAALSEMSGGATGHAQAEARAMMADRNVPGQRDMLLIIANGMTRDGRQGVIPAAALSGLSMPVTVFWGAKDAVLPVSQAGNLPGHFDVRLLPGLGHMLIEEAGEEIARHLRSAAADRPQS